MPFRRWYAEHGFSHPVAYSMLTLALGMLTCMIVSVVVSVQASDRAIERAQAQQQAQEQKVQEAKRAQQEETKRGACMVIKTMAEVYRNPVPPTATGRKAGQAWDHLSTIFQCAKE